MLKTDPILGKRYSVASEWPEVSIASAIDIQSIELPQSFKDLYTLEDKKKIKLTDDDIAQTIPDIQSKILSLLSDIPDYICARLDVDSLMTFYNKYCAALHFGILHMNYDGEVIENFKIYGNKFQIPKAAVIQGARVPFKTVSAGQFCDVVECLSQGVAGLPVAMAILCSEEKYDEQAALERIEVMRKGNMQMAFSVLASITETINYISAHYKWVFDKSSTDSKIKSAYNRSGLSAFGANAWLYEVAESGICGPLQRFIKMPLYDFVSVLSYLRCKNKIYEYANKVK